MLVPLCFHSPADFERWRKSLFHCGRNDKLATHCRDCLPSYQLRMKKLHRCEHPEVMFSLDAEGGVFGQ